MRDCRHAARYTKLDHVEGERILNHNIVGNIIDYYEAGDWWRVKVSDYDPILGLHQVDSSGLDVYPSTGEAWSVIDFDLNRALLEDKIRVIEAEDVIFFDDEMTFNENLLGKKILFKGEAATVYDYLDETREHVLFTLQGDKLKVNLNYSPLDASNIKATLHIPGSEPLNTLVPALCR